MTTAYKVILSLSLMMIVCFSFAPSAYSWLYYSKPEFRGRVIDTETKQPVEGAVVVVLYEKLMQHKAERRRRQHYKQSFHHWPPTQPESQYSLFYPCSIFLHSTIITHTAAKKYSRLFQLPQ